MKPELKLVEARGDEVTFTFGRFNPPTIGHEKLMDATKKIGRNYRVYASHTQDANKNPLDYKSKVSYMKRMFPKHKKNIVPVFANGLNSKKFYNIAYWRKAIGIKANLEMLFLADEMFKQKGNTISFIFGKEISWDTFNNSISPTKWAQKVKNHVYQLKTNNNKVFSANN